MSDAPKHPPRCTDHVRRIRTPTGVYYECVHCGRDVTREKRYIDELNKPDTPLETWIRKNL